MIVKDFIEAIGCDFYTGVPDSLLAPLTNWLADQEKDNSCRHIIAANEGNAVGIATGYYLATAEVPVVYMQNSGEGNTVNPIVSLLNEKVYAVPVLFIIGWRGEPGVHDEPQHVFQGELTLSLLELMGISYHVIDEGTSVLEIKQAMEGFRKLFAEGRQAAFVIRKGALSYGQNTIYKNAYRITREEAIQEITKVSSSDPIIVTTGKAGRELFEIRDRNGQGHEHDFLTVGSMGHASSVALGIAIQKPEQMVWCIDGDGAAIMHMGALAIIGKTKPRNLVHIVINNESHESVGGLPTAATDISFSRIANACGYMKIHSVDSLEALQDVLKRVKEESALPDEKNHNRGPFFIEIKCAIQSRKDLGRPTLMPTENKAAFMKSISR